MSASEIQEGGAAAHEDVATKEVPKETVQEVTNDHEKEDAASSPVTETKEEKNSQRPASLAPSTDLSDTDDKDTVSLSAPIPSLLTCPWEGQVQPNLPDVQNTRARADQRQQPRLLP